MGGCVSSAFSCSKCGTCIGICCSPSFEKITNNLAVLDGFHSLIKRQVAAGEIMFELYASEIKMFEEFAPFANRNPRKVTTTFMFVRKEEKGIWILNHVLLASIVPAK